MKVLVNRFGYLTSDGQRLRHQMMLENIIRDENWDVEVFGVQRGQWSVPVASSCIIFCGGQKSLVHELSNSTLTLAPKQAGDGLHFRVIAQNHDVASVKRSALSASLAPLNANAYVDVRRGQNMSTDGGKVRVAQKIYQANVRAHKLFTYVLVYSGVKVGTDHDLLLPGRASVQLTTLASQLANLNGWRS